MLKTFMKQQSTCYLYEKLVHTNSEKMSYLYSMKLIRFFFYLFIIQDIYKTIFIEL